MRAPLDLLAGGIALALTKRMVIDITTARAAVDEAIRRMGSADFRPLGTLGQLKPVANEYLRDTHIIKPRDRFHRLVSRMSDMHYDDLTEDRIEHLERIVDEWRWMNAAGDRLDTAS